MTTISTPTLQGPATQEPLVTHIRARSNWKLMDFPEVWRFRDLLWILALRDIQVRYKQTALGAIWAILQPVMHMLVFTVFFGKLMGLENRLSEVNGKAVPYAVFSLCGLVLWNFFASAMSSSSMSLVANAQIVTKVYFPRLIVPLSAAGAPLLDCAIALVVMLVATLYYQQPLTLWLLLIPLPVLATWLAAMGVGIFLSALTVTYRDFKHVIPFMVNVWFFVTPVLYPVGFLPADKRWLLYLNPMAGPIEAMRSAVVGTPMDLVGLSTSLGISLLAVLAGLMYFDRVERRFADVA